MIKRVFLLAVLISSLSINAQKPQRFGYIDMEYILENIPEYTDAQAKINAKALTWTANIEKKQNEIDDLKADLRNEKVLLTPELIEEREEDIQIKEFDLKKLKSLYFGTNGDLYFLRQQLVKPIQDLVYNAVQDIAVKRKYDFVLDKSTDLIMLYTNKQYDISDLVITSITRAKKVDAANAKRSKKQGGNDVSTPEVVSEEVQKKLDDKELKRAELQKRLEIQKAEKLKKREELLKANEAKKQQRVKEIEEANKAKENKNQGDNDVSTPEVVSEEVQKKSDDKELKRAELQKRLELQKAEKLKKREELLKANEAKKQQRIKEIEEANKAKENKNQE